jgi:ferritin-like metal-binding protein YciE
MPQPKTLHDAFVDELRDVYNAEKQLIKALPRLARAAGSPALREAMELHLEETEGQVARLESIFETLEEKARGKHCDGMAGILDEGRNLLEEDFEDGVLDASLIAAAQRVEHYEMAAYGTLVAWANRMGHRAVAELLEETLEEEKATDAKLTALAESQVNPGAAAH